MTHLQIPVAAVDFLINTSGVNSGSLKYTLFTITILLAIA
jgi:hypothetical protein